MSNQFSSFKFHSLLKMACPFTFKYIVFCPECGLFIREEEKKNNRATCGDCNLDLSEYLTRNMARFLVFPLKEQIQNYFGDKDFTSIIRVFSFYRHGKVWGPLHKEILEKLNLDTNLGIDAAPLTRESSQCVYPAVLHLNNLPLSIQHRYPILLSLYVGPPAVKPTAQLMLRNMKKEMRTLASEKIAWTDDRNVQHESNVYLTMTHSDAPMKQELQCMVGATSEFCCNYCEYQGEHVNSETYPEIYQGTNRFRRTKSETSGVR